MDIFEHRKKLVEARYEELVTRTNKIIEGNGVYNRYCNPVITAEMVPPFGSTTMTASATLTLWSALA